MMKNNTSSINFFLTLFITLLFFSSSFATTHTWLGGVGSWHQAAKWDTGLVPIAGDEVIIPSGVCKIKPGQTGYAKGIEIQTGATFKIAQTGSLITDNTTDGTAIDNNGTCLILGHCVIQNVTYVGSSFPSAIENTNLLKVGINGSLTILDAEKTAFLNHGTTRNKGSISIEEFKDHGISNSNIFENEGSIIIDSPATGANVGINNSGSFTNNAEGTISISDMPLYGFNVFTTDGFLHNYGTLDVYFSNIGLLNTGEVYNYDDGIINIQHPLTTGIDNRDIFENEGHAQVYYSDNQGVYNEGNLNVIGSLYLIGSNGTALINTAAGTTLNSGLLTISGSPEGVNNSGLFTNQEEGFCDFSSNFNNHNDAFNLGVWVNFVDIAYPNNPGALFINYGIIEDRFDVLPTSILNQQIIIRRLSATLQVGVPFNNPIDVFSSSNFDIPVDWELSIFGGFAGTYDEPSNTFTPDAAAAGATELIISTEMISTGFSRNYTLKLDTPIAPFKTNDKPQFSFGQQISEIQLYPNPVVERLTFVKNDSEVAKFIIYNTNGQALKTVVCDQSSMDIEIPTKWADGFYILNTYSDSGKKLASQTFTIQR